MTRAGVLAMIEHEADSPVAGPYVQPREALLGGDRPFAQNAALLAALLDGLAHTATGGGG